jgi:DNA polymerase III epsilon subunit family exonuclease
MPISCRSRPPAPVRGDGARFVFFDLETTGLSPRGDRIIEIAALRVGSRGGVRRSFQALVKIEERVPRFITRLTGITDAMLMDGDPIAAALPGFCEFVEDLPLVAYNVAFDMGFLRAEARRLRMRVTNAPVCALQIARAKLPHLSNHKLKTVARHLGLAFDQSHRALDDCEMGLQVYVELTRA